MAGPQKQSTTRRRKASLPRTGTRAAEEYFDVYREVNGFFHWLLHLVGSADHVVKIATEALISVTDSEEERRRMKEKAHQPGPLDELKRQRQLILEIVLVRHIEAYLNYLAGLLFEIFTQRPETLRSSDQVEVSRVLQHKSIQELVHELAQRKVDSLSYSSFDDLAAFFSARFGLEIVQQDAVVTIKEAIETRNISVHNRCIVNERYVARTGADPGRIGKRRTLVIRDLDQLIPLLCQSVRSLDRAARKKLRLIGVRFKSARPSAS